MLRQASPTANQLRLYRGWVSFRAAAFNVCAFLYNCTAGLIRPHLTYATARLPPNGPRLMEAIYAAHGFQIFEAGAFNADPHAGNVLLDEQNETVHLVDYGQLVEISEKDRLAFAYLLIALDESDADAAHETFQTWGCESTWKGKRDPDGRYKDPPMKPPPVWVALASAHMNFGGAAGMAYGLKAFEFETVAQLLGPELDDMVTNEKLPSIMMMLMRCCMCLGGTGDACGLFAVSPGKMLLPSAKAYLQKRGLPLRNPDAAPKRKNALTN
uniref:ABC1 atypical kinase-like domain-containing protein n=1 Tax=Haptolina ericina TaxID=156174 RepID=A0A7S3B849_9EUKA